MKLLTTATIILLALTGTAKAETNDVCPLFYQVASVIMEARQEGVPMPKMMDIFKENAPAIELIKIAYSKSRYHTKSVQRDVINNFANEVAVACYNKFGVNSK